VPLTLSAAAARAAVSVAARLGVVCAAPVVLADGANVVIHLSPSPVVAKVAASTPAVRADVAAWLQRELDLAAYLAGAGLPVLAPSCEVPATVHQGDGHVMSFWTYLKLSYPRSEPVLAPLADIPAFLARPQTLLTVADVSVLSEAFTRLTEDLARAGGQGQVLHGDAGLSNLMAADCQWVWFDFEDTCWGPVAWDLAATTASPRLDRLRILASYGDPVDAAQLHTCEQLRRLHLTMWYALYAERLPECRQRAMELMSTWRPSL
jgi:hypothetical protein